MSNVSNIKTITDLVLLHVNKWIKNNTKCGLGGIQYLTWEQTRITWTKTKTVLTVHHWWISHSVWIIWCHNKTMPFQNIFYRSMKVHWLLTVSFVHTLSLGHLKHVLTSSKGYNGIESNTNIQKHYKKSHKLNRHHYHSIFVNKIIIDSH